MEIIQVVGILLAIVVIIYAAMKGFNILIVAPIASIIVILTNQMDFFSSINRNREFLYDGSYRIYYQFLCCIYVRINFS